ncbi:MAG TPA: glutamate mutase L, partial [Herpetosiphonaceae bacterium]|nr:glutamate mutase L [Herpetosiphonaceae bacterium]
LDVVPNLRPNATSSRLSPVRAAIAHQHLKRCLPALPGFERLQKWRTSHAGAVADDQGVMVRFLAERFERDVLAIDAGATHTVLQTQASGHYSQVVLTGLGTKEGSSDLVDTVGAESITRWLPFEITPTALENRLLNRQLWPHLPPTDLDELLLDHALVREAIGAGLTAMRETRAALHYDMVVAGGVLARSPHPAYAALTLLDTLLSDEHRSHFAIDLYLDRFGLLATSGALARINPDAAVCLLERDGLSNGPLATVVLPHGDLIAGRLALQVELTPVGGEPEWIEVQGGSIARIALPRGRRGTLRIRPAGGVRIGPNAPGAEVLSDEAAISGSALGVIVDARPRPLSLPPAPAERAALFREWLDALGAPPPRESTSMQVAIESPSGPADVVSSVATDFPKGKSLPVAKIYDRRPADPAVPPPAPEIHPTPDGNAAGAAPVDSYDLDPIAQDHVEPAERPRRRGFLRRRR